MGERGHGFESGERRAGRFARRIKFQNKTAGNGSIAMMHAQAAAQ